MKTAPAYSAVALIIILVGYTLALAGYPASVFAQEEVTTEPDTTETDGSDASEITEAEGITDSYPRERLMSNNVFSDFVVGPGRFVLEIAPGESKTVEMTVTNRMGLTKLFSLTTEDMSGTSDPDESLVLLGDEVGPYTIKDYISVPDQQFQLEHAERARIPVTISIPPDAEPGGFYGSILTQIVSEDVVAEGGEVIPSSKIVSRIGTLFFVTTPGDIKRDLELKEFSTLENQRFYTSGPVDFTIVTENSGSVHVTPYGELRIFNTLGNEVGYVDIPPWYVLPNSIRNKEIKWNREFLVGRYTAVLELNRSYDGIIDEVRFSFWVVPLELIAAIFAALFVLFLLIRFFFSQFEFRRKR